MTDTHHGTVIGLDIGGTKTRGIRIMEGTIADDRSTGSANVQNVPLEEAANRLKELLSALGASDADTVVVGAGGIDTDADADQLRRLIAPPRPARRYHRHPRHPADTCSRRHGHRDRYHLRNRFSGLGNDRYWANQPRGRLGIPPRG